MIPLINVVFLMLAFFMIAGNIQQSGPTEVEPPQSISATIRGDFGAVLHVSAGGATFLDSVPIAVDELTPIIAARIEQELDVSEFRILVKADGTLPADALRNVLKRLRAAGLLKVSLATLHSDDSSTSSE